MLNTVPGTVHTSWAHDTRASGPGSPCTIITPSSCCTHHLQSPHILSNVELVASIMRSVQAMAAVLILAALLGCVLPTEAGRTMLTAANQKNLKSLLPKLPGCSPPPAPVDTPYTPTTPDTYTPTPATPSEPSPVYSPPADTAPPAGGY